MEKKLLCVEILPCISSFSLWPCGQLANGQPGMMYENHLFCKEGSQPYNFWWPADQLTVLIYNIPLIVLEPITT